MPSMFGRRRGSSASRSNTMTSLSSMSLDRSTTSNAAAAASSAFLKKQPSTASLSSAAAAAALRSHTTTPEPVGNIQTKRMVRRGSTSSNGSGSVIMGGRPGLQRRDSSSSMTERTFRSPSPGRSSSMTSAIASDAPPVPAIPKRIPSQHQRSNSLEPPQRMTSPTPGQSGRAMSMDRRSTDRRSVKPPSSFRGATRLSDVNEGLEPIDVNNINFSRPRSSNPSSPVSPTGDMPYTHGTGAWFSEPVPHPSTASPQSARETALEQKIARIQAAAGQPMRQTHEDTSAQGSHLSRAAQQSYHGPPPMSYKAADTIMVYDPNSRTFVAKPKSGGSLPPQPPSPALPLAPQAAPGTYDANTRTIVPALEPKLHASGRSSVDTNVQPPPRNPARVAAGSSPSGSRLSKQPSVVRELPEEEDATSSQAGSDLADSARFVQTSYGPAKSYEPASVPKQNRPGSLDVPRGTFDSALRSRGGSTSPSPQRSARFSASPVIKAMRHDPPARDISPVKSALKHSPASSLRTTSPLANYSIMPKSPASETSDTASQASQDAFSAKKKKSVRVSFDEQLHEIEAATAVATPTALSRSRPNLDDVDDDAEIMKPRPALPSFGSVRKQRVEPEIAEKVTEMAPERQDASNDHAIGGILKHAQDQKPDGVAVKDTAGYEADEEDDMNTNPTVTSTPKPTTSPDVKVEPSPEEPKVRDFAAAAPVESKVSGDHELLPAINLLPPTPALEEERKLAAEDEQSPRQKASFEIQVPGGWAKPEEDQAEVTSASAAVATGAAIEAQDEGSVVRDDIAKPEDRSPLLTAINEDSSDSAEFSDAAEDLSEIDNGGFISLDAIAVSPVAKPSPADRSAGAVSPPESPSVQQASKRASRVETPEPKTSGDWGETTAYWSKLSRQQREQIEREHFSSDDEARPVPSALKKKEKKRNDAVTASAAAAHNVQDPPAAGPAQPALRKSMRAQPAPAPVENDVHMRRSMRANGPTSMSGASLRNGPPPSRKAEPQDALQRKTMRPASTSLASTGLSTSAAGVASVQTRTNDPVPVPAPAQDSAYPKIQPKPRAQPKPQPAPVMTAKVQRELANDSDSESSFKKKRRAKSSVDASGRYTMSRGMRGASVEPTPARQRRPVSPDRRAKEKDSFSIRSLSPTGSLFGRKKAGDELRKSLRGSSVEPNYRTTLRNGPPARSSSARPVSNQPSAASKYKSRFADSDDEDEGARPKRGMFRSRFTDSDDEDDDLFIPADLTPVRGIPRRQGQNDGDSTDLEGEEEDDDEEHRKASRTRVKQATPLVPSQADIDAAMGAARKKLGMTDAPASTPQSSNQGGALQNGSMRRAAEAPQPESPSRPLTADFTPEKKKRGLMGSILRRNRASTASVPTFHSPGSVPSSPLVANAPPMPPLPSTMDAKPSSDARPQNPVSPNGKLVRRTSAQTAPRIKRGDSNYSNATAPPAVGESTFGDWPLPDVPKVPDEYANGRPNTSDGASKAGVRFDDEAKAMYSERTGRKKRFGLLRRAFRLND